MKQAHTKKLAGRAWAEAGVRIRWHLADAEGQQPEPQMKMQTGPRLEPHEMQERPQAETHGDMRKRPKPEPHGKLPKLGPGTQRATKNLQAGRRADWRADKRVGGQGRRVPERTSEADGLESWRAGASGRSTPVHIKWLLARA